MIESGSSNQINNPATSRFTRTAKSFANASVLRPVSLSLPWHANSIQTLLFLKEQETIIGGLKMIYKNFIFVKGFIAIVIVSMFYCSDVCFSETIKINEKGTKTDEYYEKFIIDNCKSTPNGGNVQGHKKITRKLKHDVSWEFEGKSGIGGEIPISWFSSLNINLELAAKYGKNVGQEIEYSETFNYDVPPGTSYEYVIKWEKVIKSGIVESGNKIINYSYPVKLIFEI